jgi:hypothetical protein
LRISEVASLRVCPRCGYRENPHWVHSRFDFNADYMPFEEAKRDPELKEICAALEGKRTYQPIEAGPYVYYRRGTGGAYLYRVLKEDFKVPRERIRHKLDKGLAGKSRRLEEYRGG